ncbi:MAG: prolyl oligopeptidase family serine peptidase, partial [Petrimonas sp.]|uniref:prolyl oligopeptidase family serine peptidase n=1 Tax=Petrimonas sp. TaxID=2023866 RepID=UPI002B3C4F93|nr:prolyl oligopeptidase family serine peptidase [Petrimonas sp.]
FGNQLFFLTFKDAPNFKIGVTDIKNPDFEKAKTIVPNGDETITSLDISKNYLFFAKSNGITQNLYRIDPKNNEIHKIETPGGVNLGFSINGMESDEIAIINSNWLSPDYFLEYDLARQQPAIKSSWLNSDSRFPDFSRLYDIKEIEVPGHDGVMIPLSIVFPKNIKLDGSTPCFITGYGGYGYSFYPFFLGEEIAFLQQGGMIAIAHVRGGGEKGEEWHQAGMKADKPNTWKDFISCAEYLIRAKYTSARKITGEGASAGGILIGRAITERPDLFAVAINIVGMTQTLRNEVTANGDNQIPEIGSVKNKEDIDALIEMDVQSKIRKGVKYPAVLTITGINDSRVVPWMPAKFTAALQANSTSGKPVLLSVNYKAGHGVNDIKDYQKLLADMFSFALWQTGP